MPERLQHCLETGGPWIFHHAHKTAGTSLALEMETLFAPYRNLHTFGSGSAGPDKMERVVERFLNEHDLVRHRGASGHLERCHADLIRRRIPAARWITLLREPITRFVSEFHYFRSPRHPGADEIARRYPTLAEYASEPAHANRMTRMLLGDDIAPHELANALSRDFHLVGTVNRYRDFFNVLTAIQGCTLRPIEKVNVAKGKRSDWIANRLPNDVRKVIEDANQLDIALYNAANHQIETDWPAMRAFVRSRRRSPLSRHRLRWR